MNVHEAEKYIRAFIAQQFPQLRDISEISLNTSKVSLNSINGIIRCQKREYFFKFHAEEGEEKSLKNSEYYKAKLLKNAGFPLLEPLYVSGKPGNQCVIYEKISAPTAYELFEREENCYIKTKQYDKEQLKKLLEREDTCQKQQSEIFLSTLKKVRSTEMRNASINQLFLWRLCAKNDTAPRLDKYYLGKKIKCPYGNISFTQLSKLKWRINEINYNQTISEIIEDAKNLLNPEKNDEIAVVLGHGDAHNGNKFCINGECVLFDPAFGGWQPALLTDVKALAHNVFLHPFWLYDPKMMDATLKLNYKIIGNTIEVTHNWGWPKKSPIRRKLLDLERKNIWQPLISTMKERKMLPKYWREYLRKALFVCPFLVVNLIDEAKYSPAQTLLALSKCVELGSKGDKENYVDYFFKEL